MKFLKFGIIAAILLCTKITSAQQLPIFTKYIENLSVINPASITRDQIVLEMPYDIGFSYRNQWVNVDGAPTTQAFRFSAKPEDTSLGYGINLINDQTGAIGFTGVYGRAAYHFAPSRDYNISIGLSAGAVQYRVDEQKLDFGADNESASELIEKKIAPDFGIGVFAYSETFFGGLSVPQTFGLDLEYDAINPGETLNISRVQHIYAMGGAFLYLDGYGDQILEPHMWIKYTSGAPVNIDGSLRYRYKETVFGGVGYASSGSAHIEAGVTLNEYNSNMEGNIQIGYAYGAFFKDYGPTFGGAHEINLSYSFGN